MTSNPMKFLNDTEFYKWMAVCDKKKRDPDTLLKEILGHSIKNDDIDGSVKEIVLNYIDQNLAFAEFDEYVKKTRSPSNAAYIAENNVRTGRYSKANRNKIDIVKFEPVKYEPIEKIMRKKITSPVEEKQTIDVDEISVVKIDNATKLLPLIEIEKKNDDISANDEIIKKYKLIEKMRGIV